MSDTRDLYKLFRELESQHQENDTVRLHDSFDLELNEHFVIESGVVGLTEDGVIIQLDEAALEFLDFNGMLTESLQEVGLKDHEPRKVEGVYGTKSKPFTKKFNNLKAMNKFFDHPDNEGNYEIERISKVSESKGLNESVEDSDIFAKVVKSDDPFQVVYDGISGHFGEKARMKLQDMYDAVASDNRYHPDDDFEEIIDLVIDHIVADDAFKNSGRGARDVDESAIAEGSSQGVANAIRHSILHRHKDVVAKYGPVRIMAAIRDKADNLNDLEEIGSSDVSIWTREVIDDLEKGYYDDEDTVSVKRDVPESAEDSDIFAKIVKSDDPFQVIYDGISGHFGEVARIKLQDIYDDVALDHGDHPDDDFEEIIDRMIPRIHELHDIGLDYSASKKDELDEIKKLTFGRDALEENPMLMALGRMAAVGAARDLADNVDEGWGKNLLGAGAVVGALAAIAGVDKMEADRLMKTEPQLVTLTQMRQEAEQEGDDSAVDALDNRIRVTLNSIRNTGRPVMGPDGEPVDPRKSLGEAEYQGRKVTLNKPMQGDVAKSKVYVKKPDGKVVKVNFGDKNMTIKKSNPARRKSFRARHNCENPGPKWKARYWSCRAW